MLRKNIFAVTVTYGRRWHLLRQVIQAALSQGIARVIIVNNGALENIAELASEEFGEGVDVLTLQHNTGSAGGFSAGLRRVVESNPEYVLLLDDDNKILPGCIDGLMSLYEQELYRSTRDNLAVLAFRPVRLVDVSMGVPVSRINPRAGSYFGFHILDIPFKLWRRLPKAKQFMAKSARDDVVLLNVASWSGLLFSVDLIKKHGYPNTDFFLYADDTEYTLRITQGGGRIILCKSALIEDIDQSWNPPSLYANTFDGLLLGDGDFRAYYSTRNQAYLEYHRIRRVFIWSVVNRWAHTAILTMRALMLNRFSRWKLLMDAMSDGKKNRLGVNKRFPL